VAHPALSGRSVKLATHIHLLLTFGVDGTVTLLPFYDSLAWLGTTPASSKMQLLLERSKMRWAGYVARMGENDLEQVLWGN